MGVLCLLCLSSANCVLGTVPGPGEDEGEKFKALDCYHLVEKFRHITNHHSTKRHGFCPDGHRFVTYECDVCPPLSSLC